MGSGSALRAANACTRPCLWWLDQSFALAFTFLAAFLPAPIQKVLGGAGVEPLVGGK